MLNRAVSRLSIFPFVKEAKKGEDEIIGYLKECESRRRDFAKKLLILQNSGFSFAMMENERNPGNNLLRK